MSETPNNKDAREEQHSHESNLRFYIRPRNFHRHSHNLNKKCMSTISCFRIKEMQRRASENKTKNGDRPNK